LPGPARLWALPTFLVLLASTGSAYISSIAGQQLAFAIGVGIEHATYGIITPPVATIATVMFGLWWWASIVDRSATASVIVRRSFAALATIGLLASLVLTVLAGHSGAKLSWDPKMSEVTGEQVSSEG